MIESQNWTQDKFGFLWWHIRYKWLNKLSAIKSQTQGASALAFTAHNMSKASTDTNSMEISMRSTDTTLQPQQFTSPTSASGHSLVDQQVLCHTDEKQAVTIPWAGDNNTYTLLQLPGIRGRRNRRERISLEMRLSSSLARSNI